MTTPLFHSVLFFVSTFASWLATRGVRAFVLKKNVLDVPNERSSHSVPTPRGGGLAIVTVFSLSLLISTVFGWTGPEWLVALGAGVCVSILGWRDDVKGLSAGTRLGVQMGAAIVAVAVLRRFPLNAVTMDLDLGVLTLSNGILIEVFLILFTVWMTNLYNFMDGIDGILGLQALTVSAGVIALALVSPVVAHDTILIHTMIVGTCIGFLVLNWSPAKIFMGDVGSAFLGFILALFVFIAVAKGHLSWTSAIVLHAAFVGDSTWTLFARLMRGQKPHQAHRSHIYQKMVRKGYPHARVSAMYGAFNLIWLLPVAYAFEKGYLSSLAAYALAYMPVFVMAIIYGAGKEPAKA